MSSTLLALSHKAELGMHARVVGDAQAVATPLGFAMLITGAFARDETEQRQIAWPPAGDVVMDVFGFREAEATAVGVELPQGVQAAVVSLPALAWLKIVCWQDRHRRSPGKDAQDLQQILNHYLETGQEPRLWDEFLPWTQEDSFDYVLAGARMLGRDIAAQLDAKALARVSAIITQQANTEQPGVLPGQMNASNPEQAVLQLQALLRGLNEKCTA